MTGAGGNPFTVPWLSFGWYDLGLLVWLALPGLMGFGAILFETWQHLGVRLVEVGAIFSTVFLLPFAVTLAVLPGPWDIGVVTLRCLFGTTAILILLTDVILIRTARAHRNARRLLIH